MDRLEILADSYPISVILEQNDIEPLVVFRYLEEEGLINVNDYFDEETPFDE